MYDCNYGNTLQNKTKKTKPFRRLADSLRLADHWSLFTDLLIYSTKLKKKIQAEPLTLTIANKNVFQYFSIAKFFLLVHLQCHFNSG